MDNQQLIESLEHYTTKLNEVSVKLLKKAASNVVKSRALKAAGTALNPFKNATAKQNAAGRLAKAATYKSMKTGSGKMSANKVVNAAKNSAPVRLAKINKGVVNRANAGVSNDKKLVKRAITSTAIANKPATAIQKLTNQIK